VPVFG
jgi:transposase, IS5 family